MVRHEAPWAPAPAQLREPLVPVEPSRPNHEAPWAAAADPGSSRERARSHVPRQAGLYTTRPNTTYVAAHVPRQGCATSATWLCCESMRGLAAGGAGVAVALACPSPRQPPPPPPPRKLTLCCCGPTPTPGSSTAFRSLPTWSGQSLPCSARPWSSWQYTSGSASAWKTDDHDATGRPGRKPQPSYTTRRCA